MRLGVLPPLGMTASGLCVPGQALLKIKDGLEPGEPLPLHCVHRRRNYASETGLWSNPRPQLSGCPPPASWPAGVPCSGAVWAAI